MDEALTSLIAAAVTFVGTHFALSHPLRAPLVKAVGDKGFQGVYSLVALASFVWMVTAFRAIAPAEPLWEGMADLPWIIATVLMLPASVLLVGSFTGNPAMQMPGAAAAAARGPHGVFHTTRHPMMWSFALWSAAHLLVSPTPRVIVLSLTIALLALIGAHLQDRKKQTQMGATWAGWQAQTSYWPGLGALAKAGAVPWLGGIALWLVASWAHGWLIALPAGVWRWLG